MFEPNIPRRVKRGWMNLKVSEVIDETHDTKTFVMVDNEEGGRVFDYYAGQYLTFRFDGVAEKPLVRSYTMSSSPCQPDSSAFTVKRVEGGIISNWLCDHIKVGDVLRGRGPIGRFCYDSTQDKPHLVMVAGGSGVTPFVSIMREYAPLLGQPGAPQKVSLLVAYRSRDDLICKKELEEISSFAGARVVMTLTRDPDAGGHFLHSRPSPTMLREFFGNENPHAMTVMSCGPQAIMDLTVESAKEFGVPPEQIKTESFES